MQNTKVGAPKCRKTYLREPIISREPPVNIFLPPEQKSTENPDNVLSLLSFRETGLVCHIFVGTVQNKLTCTCTEQNKLARNV